MSETTTARRPGNPNWVRGGASPNPGGRTPATDALQNTVRRKADPEELFDIAMDIARHNEDDKVRLAALAWLSQVGYSKPATETKLDVRAAPALPAGFDAWPLEQRRAWIADRRRAAIAGTMTLPILDVGEAEQP